MYKKLYLLLLFSLFFTQQCTSQTNIDKALLESKTFTFQAERIVPMSNEAVNILNSNTRPSSDFLNINGDGYGMILKGNTIDLDLPYVGRSYTPSMGERGGVRETIKEFSLKENHTPKKSTFEIKPKDSKNINEIIIDVFKNGKAYVSINFFNKQSISYDGIVIKNQEE